MPRPRRINPAGGIHHITNHRSGDGDLFVTDRDRLLFLTLIEKAREATGVRIHAYCLMGNHYHIVVECPDGQLHRFVHYLQGNYARAFCYRHGHEGAVFRRRYHNVLVTSDAQFQMVLRYVHRNPLELGFDIRHYPWSDYPAHAGIHVPTSDLVTVTTTTLRSIFGPAINYVDHVETDADRDRFSCSDAMRQVRVRPVPSVSTELSQLIEVLVRHTGCDRAGLKISRRGSRNDARLIGVVLASDRFPTASDQVQQLFGFTTRASYRSALSRARNQVVRDLELSVLIQEIATAWQNTSSEQAA